MYVDRLYKNIVDQVKEVQQKLGYVKETVRLYYQLSTVNALLGTSFVTFKDVDEAIDIDGITTKVYDNRLLVCVSPDLCEKIHREDNNPFLMDIIELFQTKHNCTIEEICSVFAKYSESYICDKIDNGEFDYAVHFVDETIDEYYYCIKFEGHHSIYHRFMKEDYLEIMKED